MVSPIRTLEIVVFLDLLAAGLIVPQLPNQARALGCSHVLVGIMGALYSGFQLLSGPMTGSLSDIKGRTSVLFVTLALSGLSYVALGVTSSIVLFLALRSILGITKHTQLVTKALAPEYVKDKNHLSKVFGRLSTLKQAGMSVGPIIAGYIMEMYPESGFMIIAHVVGAIFAINAGLVQKLPQVDEEKKEKKKDKAPIAPYLMNTVTTHFKESLDQFYKVNWSVYGEVFLFRLLISLCIGVYVNNYVLFLRTKHNITPITIGYIIAFFSAIGSVTTYYVGYINKYYNNDKDYTERNLHVFAALTMSLLGVVAAPSIPVYVAFLIPLGVSSAVGRLVSLEVILSKTDSSQRGLVLGVANNVRALSGVIAPLIVGLIGEYIGILYVVYVSVILAAVGTYKSYEVRSRNVEQKKK